MKNNAKSEGNTMKAKRSFVSSSFLMTILLSPSAVHAQEQTVEGAQKFLSIVLPGNGYMTGTMHALLRDGIEGARKNGVRSLSGDIQGKAIIVDATVVAHCESKLLSDYSNVELKFSGRQGTGALEHWTITSRQLNFLNNPSKGGVTRFGSQAGSHWSIAKSVRPSGGNVYIMFDGNEDESTIYLNSEDLARRVAYAIDFLRTNCDKTAGTGF